MLSIGDPVNNIGWRVDSPMPLAGDGSPRTRLRTKPFKQALFRFATKLEVEAQVEAAQELMHLSDASHSSSVLRSGSVLVEHTPEPDSAKDDDDDENYVNVNVLTSDEIDAWHRAPYTQLRLGSNPPSESIHTVSARSSSKFNYTTVTVWNSLNPGPASRISDFTNDKIPSLKIRSLKIIFEDIVSTIIHLSLMLTVLSMVVPHLIILTSQMAGSSQAVSLNQFSHICTTTGSVLKSSMKVAIGPSTTTLNIISTQFTPLST